MVRLRFETDLGNTLKAHADLQRVVDDLAKGYSRGTAEAKKLEIAAKRIVEQNETPQERYNRKIDQLGKAIKAGAVGFDDAQKAAARLRQKLEDASQSGDKVFGQAAIDRIAGYALGLIGVQQLVQGIGTAFSEVERRAKAAGDAVFHSLSSFGELQQVSTSQADFNSLVATARGLVGPVFAKGQEGQAANLVFALRNAGYSDADIGFITQLGKSRQVAPENLQQVAEGLKKFQDIFGAGETGGVPQVARKVFSAAGATQASFSQVAAAATLFGTEAKAAGATDEEALAAFVAIEKQSPGVEEAATRLRGVFNQIIQKDLKRDSFGQTLDRLVGRVRGGEAAINILGETRAAAGLNILAGVEGQAVFGQQLSEITAAQSSDIIESRRFLTGDRQLTAALNRGIAEGAAGTSIQAVRSEAANRLAGRNARREQRLAEQGVVAELFAGFMDALFGRMDQTILLHKEQRQVLKEIEASERLKPPPPSGRQQK